MTEIMNPEIVGGPLQKSRPKTGVTELASRLNLSLPNLKNLRQT